MKTAALFPALLAVPVHAQTITIDPANPHYYFFHGKPTVLLRTPLSPLRDLSRQDLCM
jgi:hypothetical protein